MAARGVLDGFCKRWQVLPPGRRLAVAGGFQQFPIDQGDAAGEIPGDPEGAHGACAGLPSSLQVPFTLTRTHVLIQVQQSTPAGEFGRKLGVQVHHIRCGAGKHCCQQLLLHRSPRNIGPAHINVRIPDLPLLHQPLQIGIELG